MDKFFDAFPWTAAGSMLFLIICFVIDSVYGVPIMKIVSLVPVIILLLWFIFVAAKDARH